MQLISRQQVDDYCTRKYSMRLKRSTSKARPATLSLYPYCVRHTGQILDWPTPGFIPTIKARRFHGARESIDDADGHLSEPRPSTDTSIDAQRALHRQRSVITTAPKETKNVQRPEFIRQRSNYPNPEQTSSPASARSSSINRHQPQGPRCSTATTLSSPYHARSSRAVVHHLDNPEQAF